MKRRIVVSLLVLILSTSLAGCNATRGVGQDLQDAGQHIENIGN